MVVVEVVAVFVVVFVVAVFLSVETVGRAIKAWIKF